MRELDLRLGFAEPAARCNIAANQIYDDKTTIRDDGGRKPLPVGLQSANPTRQQRQFRSSDNHCNHCP